MKRKSRRGKLAQRMYTKWMRQFGRSHLKEKFPKRTPGGAQSIWWIMAGVALKGTCPVCGNGTEGKGKSRYCADDECGWSK